MPEGLWFRVAGAATVAATEQVAPRETQLADAAPRDAAPSLEPTRSWPIPASTSMSIGVGLVVALAAAVVAVVAWPGGQSLEASGLSRLTYSPARPVAGWNDDRALSARPVAQGSTAAGARRHLFGAGRSQPGPLVLSSSRSATRSRRCCRRATARTRRAFVCPRISSRCSSPSGTAPARTATRTAGFRGGVIAGEPSGAPSLRALLAAQETFAESSWGEGAARHKAENQRRGLTHAILPLASRGMGIRARLRNAEGSLQLLALLPERRAQVSEPVREALGCARARCRAAARHGGFRVAHRGASAGGDVGEASREGAS